MNCKDFSNIVNELAAHELIDATTREAGRAHAAICVYCAAKLRDAQGINSGLVVAAGAETEEAPARVKQSLLAAFAAQQSVSTGLNETEVKIAPGIIVEISNWRMPWWVAAAGVAVAAALLIALLLPSLLRVSRPELPKQAVNPKVAPAPTVPAPGDKQQNHLAGVDKDPISDHRNFSRSSKARAPGLVRRTPRLLDRSEGSETTTVAKKVNNDYFPLTYLDSSTAMESGTVVRIELSRSALISLGLPMSIEHADGLVKADLVVGDDGVARAIRLVQE